MNFQQFHYDQTHDSSIILGKIATLLSTLFDTLIPFALNGPPIALAVITQVEQAQSFTTVCGEIRRNTCLSIAFSPLQIMIIESSMIFVQCVAPNIDDYIGNWWAKGKRQPIKNTNEPIYDNLSVKHDMHED